MKHASNFVPAWAGTLILLAGCHGDDTAQQPGAQTVFADISVSTPFLKTKTYADKAIEQVSDAVTKQRLGDRFRIIPIGSRTADNAVDILSIASSQRVHLRTVKSRVKAALQGLFAHTRRDGGNGYTNIAYTLQNAHPVCNAGSAVYILSDGLESTEESDAARDLAAGRPVMLPKPSEPIFRGGCSIWMMGIGITASGGSAAQIQTLPAAKLDTLKSAWRQWFIAAGADPNNIHFETIL